MSSRFGNERLRAVFFSKLPLLLALWLIFALVTEHSQLSHNPSLDVVIANTAVSFKNYQIEISASPSEPQLDLKVNANLEVITNRIHQFRFFLDESYQVNITKLEIDGKPVEYDYQGNVCHVELPFSCFVGKKLALKMNYQIQSVVATKQVLAELRGNWYPKNLLPEMVTARFRLNVPVGMIGIANGDFREAIYLPNNLTAYLWEMNQPSSSFGVSIGKYLLSTRIVDDQPYRVYALPAYSEAYREKILDWAVLTGRYYQAEFGGENFDGLSIVLNDTEWEESSFGALIFLHLPNTQTEYALRFNLAHEIAHYWWGNLIIPKTIYDWWLVEGFANYSAWLAINNYEQQQMTVSGKQNEIIISNWRKQYRNTLVGLEHYQAPEMSLAEISPFDAQREILYTKGALVLHMARGLLGEENFRNFLIEFVKRFSFKKAGIRDFTGLGVEIYGAEWMDFFRQWVYSAGYYDLELKNVTITKTNHLYQLKASIHNIGQLSLPDRVGLEIITKSRVYSEVLHFKDVNVTIQKSLPDKPLQISVNYQNSYIPEISLEDNIWKAGNNHQNP